jgi:GAF domain-containing protein
MALDDRPRIDIQQDEFVHLLGSLQSLLLSGPRLEDFLGELAVLAADVVQPSASCGITTRYDSRPRTVASSDSRAAIIDEEQYGAGAGPCIEALDTGMVVDIADQETDERWPTYRKHAVELGVKCSLSLPLVVSGQTVGAMNLYTYGRPRAFDNGERRRAETFAAQASTALALAVRHTEQTELTDQLAQALSSRTLIDQALGILMAQQRCDADAAFELLRRHSQSNNRKLRDVATDLITRVSGRPPTPARPFEP